MNLQDHLSAAYDHSIGRSTGTPMPAFVAALDANPDLKVAAQAKLAELTDDICNKCFCSKTHRSALQDALRRTGQ